MRTRTRGRALRADGGDHDPRRHRDVPLDRDGRPALRRPGVRLAADRRRGVLRRRARRDPELLARRRRAPAGAAQPRLDGALPHARARSSVCRRRRSCSRWSSSGRCGSRSSATTSSAAAARTRGRPRTCSTVVDALFVALGARACRRRRTHGRELEPACARSARRPSRRRCSACCWSLAAVLHLASCAPPLRRARAPPPGSSTCAAPRGRRRCARRRRTSRAPRGRRSRDPRSA